jgi:hypothetical protein
MIFLSTLLCFLLLAISALGADNFAKFNQPAALGAYKDIIDAASSDPVLVLGKAWKKFNYDDYKLPAKPVLGAYQDVINAVKDPKEVLGAKTFESKCKCRIYVVQAPADLSPWIAVGYACRDSFGQTKFCRLMEDDKAD